MHDALSSLVLDIAQDLPRVRRNRVETLRQGQKAWPHIMDAVGDLLGRRFRAGCGQILKYLQKSIRAGQDAGMFWQEQVRTIEKSIVVAKPELADVVPEASWGTSFFSGKPSEIRVGREGGHVLEAGRIYFELGQHGGHQRPSLLLHLRAAAVHHGQFQLVGTRSEPVHRDTHKQSDDGRYPSCDIAPIHGEGAEIHRWFSIGDPRMLGLVRRMSKVAT